MARFGLDSDSDQSDAESHSHSHSPSAASSSSSSSRKPRHLDHSDDHDEYSQDEEEEEEAPPRQSLYDDDDDDLSQEQEDDDDGYDSDGDDGDSIMTSSRHAAASLSPRPRQRQLGSAQPPRWSTAAVKPKLARTAVMQASLFGPSPADQPFLRDQEHNDDGDEEEQERGTVEAQSGDSLMRLGGATTSRTKRDSTLENRRTQSQPEASASTTTPPPAQEQQQQQQQQRPLRPFTLVPLADSCAKNHEGSLVDASLALGRSYRVAFGPRGEVVSLRGAYQNKSESSSVQAGKLHIDRIQLVQAGENDERANRDAVRLLRLQLAKTDIYEPGRQSGAAPQAVPSGSLRFHDFANLLQSEQKEGFSDSAAAAAKNDQEARLFRLGACLFDEIADLALDQVVDPASRPYIEAIRRRRLISAWFEDAASSTVEADLSLLPEASPASPAASAKRIFALLSGHQISAACETALESSNLRLATILAQLGPDALATDDHVRADVALQLEKWREYHVDTFVDDAYRKILELVSGNLGVSPGREDLDPKGDGVDELHVLEGLEWKRALAAGAWYAVPQATGAAVAGADAGLAEVVERYERAYRADPRVAAPTPDYLLSTSSSEGTNSRPWPPPPSSSSSSSSDAPLDPAFHLLKLFTSPTHPLEAALEPRNFGPSPLDYRLPWHLYMLISRVLQRRDWEDRMELPDDEGGDDAASDAVDEDEAMMMGGRAEGRDGSVLTLEGNSVTADRVTEAYAMQLEAQGEWHWAAFVLLHIELPDRRIKSIRELLARHVEELERAAEEGDEHEAGSGRVSVSDEPLGPRQKVEFLIETLKIPEIWIDSARADYLLASPPHLFRAYTLLLAAQRAAEAHRIAAEDLVPEALVRGDYPLVRRLLEPFLLSSSLSPEPAPAPAPTSADGEPNLDGFVSGWKQGGGQTYLLFLTQPDHPHLLARAMQAVQALSKRVKESSRLRSKKLLRLAVAEMEGRLTVLAKANTPSKALERTQPSLLTASDRAVWIQGANQAFWQSAVGAAAPIRAA